MDNINLDVMYLKAKISFNECIANDDNKFLNQQIDIHISEIITKNEWIRIQFFGSDKNHYILEARLLLLSPGDKQIGYYCYCEDENGEYVDEYLVFE